MEKRPARLYFLCIQNRCRSQIAEAFAKLYGKEGIVVESAGLDASEIHPLTIEAMKEVGIDIAGNVSKKINMKTFLASTVIIKLCERLKERCPIVPFAITNVEWNIEDPLLQGEDNLDAIRRARDEIKPKVIDLLKSMDLLREGSPS